MRVRKNYAIPNRPRYRLPNFPKDFQEKDIWRNALKEIVHGIKQCKTTHSIQSDIDNVYDKLCITIENEMKIYLKPIRSVSGGIIRDKHHKPYWDDEPGELSKMSVEKEKTFRKFKGANHVKKQLKNEYNISLKYFDKNVKTKRTYISKKLNSGYKEYELYIGSFGKILLS